MIRTDGKPTIANRISLDPPSSDPPCRDEDWRVRLQRTLGQLETARRERVYASCRAKTDNVFDWLACLERASL